MKIAQVALAESDAAKKKLPTAKVELDMTFIKNLRLEKRPVIGADGKLAWDESNTERYIVYDTHREAPPGFGVRVAGKKTFIIRRKVNGESRMPTVGNVADFSHEKSPLAVARAKAARLASEIIATGKNPNAEARKIVAAEMTLGQVFDKYLTYMKTRTVRPASPETVRVIQRAARKFDGYKWSNRKVRDILPQEITDQFMILKDVTTVANEQAFRYANSAVEYCIAREALDANVAGRQPSIEVNPFSVLKIEKAYRSNQQKEEAYEVKNKRSPLSRHDTLGKFLEAAWSKQHSNDNETGVHYLIFMLLWGCRRSEHADAEWFELVDEAKRNSTTHVQLSDDPEYGPNVRFYNTKGGKRHRLPITPFALNLLKIRQASCAKELAHRGVGAKSRRFVFPARSPLSKTGHYSNPDDLREAIMEEAGIARLTNHDLRRSFGAIMEHLKISDKMQGLFLNHSHATVTDRYTPAEWSDIRADMEKIETAILATAPNVYNALRPAGWPPLPAPAPHVCAPPKARTGRPRKDALKSTDEKVGEHV
jgi:integrase